MNITVEVEGFFDWVPTKAKPTDESILAGRYKQDTTGAWLEKKVKDEATETTVNLPESQIEVCVDHFERQAKFGVRRKSREEVVAWFLEEKVMPHHAPHDKWIAITVENEPKVQKHLNSYFGLKGVK